MIKTTARNAEKAVKASAKGTVKTSSASTRAQENIRTVQQNRQFGLPSPLEM